MINMFLISRFRFVFNIIGVHEVKKVNCDEGKRIKGLYRKKSCFNINLILYILEKINNKIASLLINTWRNLSVEPTCRKKSIQKSQMKIKNNNNNKINNNKR